MKEAVPCTPGLPGGQLLLQADLHLLLVVVLQGRLNVNPTIHHGCDTFHQCEYLEVVDCPVEAVDLLGAESPYQICQVLVDVVIKDVFLELGGSLML